MERGAITYSTAFIAGATVSFFASLPPWVPLSILTILIVIILTTKKATRWFIIFSHIALACAGAGSTSIAIGNKELPPLKLEQEFFTCMEQIQMKGANYLKRFSEDEQVHSTLCALSIGQKKGMPWELREAFAKAGAIHVLALSGLHIGIVFAIIYGILGVLSLLPKGKWLKDAIAVAFIFLYSGATGFSPSVTRAAFMILIYRIAKITFRNISKWDAIALSAMFIGIVAPLQIFTVGFQLSYAAVIGIAAMFPVCRQAFETLFPATKVFKGNMRRLIKGIWDTLAVSTCCQIATMPFVLYYFGGIPQYFLISNIVAVPLATAILYNLTCAIFLQDIPLVGDILAYTLNTLVKVLNYSMNFISS